MKFVNILDEKYLFIQQEVDSYQAALQLISSKISEEKRIGCSSNDLMDALLKREELGGTVLPNGLAIPHVRLECLSDFWVSLLTPTKPIKYNDQEVKLIALFLIPKSGSDIYLQTLSGLSKFTSENDNLDLLCKAKNHRQVENIFNDLEIQKDFLVSDIMSTEITSISPQTKVKELADLLYAKNLSYLPVLTESGDFIGEVTLLDLIREGIPDYALRIGDLSFLKSFEPFEELIRKEDQLSVGDIQSKPMVMLHPDDSIAVAGLNFIRHSRRQLPVVDKGRLVGVLSIIDLLKKVIRV